MKVGKTSTTGLVEMFHRGLESGGRGDLDRCLVGEAILSRGAAKREVFGVGMVESRLVFLLGGGAVVTGGAGRVVVDVDCFGEVGVD